MNINNVLVIGLGTGTITGLLVVLLISLIPEGSQGC